jgi:hypothetical protein
VWFKVCNGITMTRRRPALLLLLAAAACAGNAATSAADADLEASDLDTLGKLLVDKVDRSTPDPSNAWAQVKVGLGEENVLADEERIFQGFADTVKDMQAKTATQENTPATRGFHAKPHGCLLGEMQIDPSALPQEARVGLFARAETLPTWVRFSSGVGFAQKDGKVDVRGLALKVTKVPGKKLLPGEEDAATQDFLMTDAPITPACDSAHFVAFGAAMANAADAQGILGRIKALGEVGGFLSQRDNVRTLDYLIHRAGPNTQKQGSTLAAQFWGGGAIAMGLENPADPMHAKPMRAAKFTAIPGVLEGDVCKHLDVKPNVFDGDYFRADLKKHLAKGAICADFMVQFQEDAQKQPIEDTSVEWTTKFVKVARVVVQAQDLDAADVKAREDRCNAFAFTPWHALPEHRPLGNIMRSRLKVYAASSEGRGHGPEPTGDE